MAKRFSDIALVGLMTDPRVAEPMQSIAAHLTKAGIGVFALPDAANEIGATSVGAAELPARVDLIVAVGGDGTLLFAANLASDSGVPLLGINRGRLGFLTDVSPAEMLASLDSILGGDYSTESRLRLRATLIRNEQEDLNGLALNDVVLQRRNTGRMLDFETRIGDRYVNTHMGDGLVVATPTGSTAYALSCGGPIIEPHLDAVVVVPICPHTLSDRPLVVSAEHRIDIALLEREDTGAEVVVDGHSLGELTPDDRLRVEASPSRVTLVHPPGYDYYEILRSKLHWGRDSRVTGDVE